MKTALTKNGKSRGRPAGATSFVNVSMEDLTKRFGSAQAIPVSRIWLRNLGIELEAAAPQVVTEQETPTKETV
jgi:hypothetical protein